MDKTSGVLREKFVGKIRDLEGIMGFEGLAENEAQKQRGMLESESAIFVGSDSI